MASESPFPTLSATPAGTKSFADRLILDLENNSKRFKLSDIEKQHIYENLSVAEIDLNHDGIPEYSLMVDHSDWCGAGGNCDVWIYQKQGDDYELLANAKLLGPASGVTNGYQNLKSRTPIGFCDKTHQRFDVTEYLFDGSRYSAGARSCECRSLDTREVKKCN